MTFDEPACDLAQEFHLQNISRLQKEPLRKHEQRLGEDDRHDAGKIDTQRHKRSLPRINLAAHRTLRMLDWNLTLRLGDRNDAGNHRHQQRQHGDQVKDENVEIAPLLRLAAEHIEQSLEGLRQTGDDADTDDQRYAVANAAFGNLLAQPHQQHGAGGDHNNGLDAVPPNVARAVHDELAAEIGVHSGRILPLHGHKESLTDAQSNREISAILNELGPATFFTSELAQARNDCREQLNDDSGADVRHNAQSAKRTVFQRAPGEHAVHAQQTTATSARSGFVEVIGQRHAIDSWNWDHGNNPANPKDYQGEDNARLQLGNLEAVCECIGDGGEHIRSASFPSYDCVPRAGFAGAGCADASGHRGICGFLPAISSQEPPLASIFALAEALKA